MKTNDRLDHLRIATPCPANWEKMSGDDRVRSCDLCNLHVYNIAQLTRREAEALIANTEGRICARLYRRADGSIISKDCPVGLRAIRQRVALVAGAVFAAIASLSGTVLGQKQSPKEKSFCKPQVTTSRATPDAQSDAGTISGTVQDPIGAVVPGVKVTVARKDGGAVMLSKSDDKGEFQVRGLKAGTYELNFELKGFARLNIVEVKLADQGSVTIAAILMPKNVEVLIGVVGYTEPLETGTTIFIRDLIRRLPIPK